MEKHEKIGFFDGIKGWCATLASIGIGVLAYIGPAGMAEEIPYHRELGAAFVAFGILFALALLFHGTEFGFRIQSLLLVVAGVFFGGLVLVGIAPSARAAWRLGAEGVETQATVQSVRMWQGKRETVRRYVVSYAGRRATIRIEGGARQGGQVPVLYLPDEPEVVLAGAKGDSFLALLDKSIGKWWAIGGSVFALFMACLALVKLKHFLLGRGADSEASIRS